MVKQVKWVKSENVQQKVDITKMWNSRNTHLIVFSFPTLKLKEGVFFPPYLFNFAMKGKKSSF